jgi:hypothetical protein
VDEAIERSRYGAQVRAMLSTLGRDRVLVQQYERCVAQPTRELARTFNFLGLPEVQVPSLASRVNRSSHRGHDAVRAAYGPMLPPDGELRERFAASAVHVVGWFDMDAALWPTLGGWR